MTTITIPRTLLEQALEAMEAFTDPEDNMPEDTGEFRDLATAMNAIRAELAKPPERAPAIARVREHGDFQGTVDWLLNPVDDGTLLYLHPPTPAWHDAPTCDGLWFCNEGEGDPYRWTTHRVTFPISPLLVGEDERWYGPIPEDGAA